MSEYFLVERCCSKLMTIGLGDTGRLRESGFRFHWSLKRDLIEEKMTLYMHSPVPRSFHSTRRCQTRE